MTPSQYVLTVSPDDEITLKQGTLEAGKLADISAEGVQAAASARVSDSWQTELSVKLDYLGGHARSSGLHVAFEGEDGTILDNWPTGSRAQNPLTWATTQLGPPQDLERSAGALFVSGRDGYLVIPYAPELFPQEYTLEAWVRIREGSCGTVLGNGFEDSIWLGICGGLQFRQSGNTSTHQGRRQLDESWHHVAVAVSGDGDETFFVDGDLDAYYGRDATPRLPATRLTRRPYYVGTDPSAPADKNYLRGYIRDLRIWNYPRSQSEIRRDAHIELSGDERGLVANWPLTRHLLDGAGDHSAGLVGKSSLVAGAANFGQFCFSTDHRAPPALDQIRTVPVTDAVTCLDLTPKVGFVTFRDLPHEVRSAFSGFDDDDRLLLYVPAAGEDGRRIATLTGANCDPDPCPKTVTCGRPTEEKCSAPKPGECATKLELPETIEIALSDTETEAKLSDVQSKVAFQGVIIAAEEIVLSGHVRTNGQNLALVAKHLTAVDDVVVDASALRQAKGATRAGGQIAVVAENVDVKGSLAFRSFGSPGALPSTTKNGVSVHWDCPDRAYDLNGMARCFPCLGNPPNTCLATGFAIQTKTGRCRTRDEFLGPTTHSYYEYPISPAQLPGSFLLKVPDGYFGGSAGSIRLRLEHTNKTISRKTGPGSGSQGLQGYRVTTSDYFWCPPGYAGCYVDQFAGASYLVPDGKSYGGTQATPIGAVSVGYRHAKDLSDFPAGWEVDRVLASVTDELLIPESYVTKLEQSYRAGINNPALGFAYAIALASLGDPWKYPCSLVGRATALKHEITARIEQWKAHLDWAGRAADWAPSTPPAELQSLVQSELQHSSQLAQSIKLDALLAITSANLEGNLVKELEGADGNIAKLEAARNEIVFKEKQARLDEVQSYVTRNELALQHLQAKLVAYYQAQSNPPSGVVDALTSLGEKLGDFIGGYVAVVKAGSDDFDKLWSLAKYGKSLYESLEKLVDAMSGDGFVCAQDSKCVDLAYQVEQARLELYGARQAVQAALYAVQAEKTNQALFDARRTLSKDIARIYQGNKFVVRDYDALSRAGRYLCQYGRMVTDNAAADLHAYKRSAAAWDVPTPIAEQSDYDGAGGRYDFNFSEFLGASCKALDCTLWGDFNKFQKARIQQGFSPPNPLTLYLGTPTDQKSTLLATFLHNPPVPGNRVEFAFGLMEFDDPSGAPGTFFGARPTGFAMDHGATATAPVLADTSFAGRYAVQLHSLVVRAYDGSNNPLRYDFPFRVSRPSSERYVNQLGTPPKELALEVTVPPGRELDGGQLLDRLAFDQAITGFRLDVCPSPCDGSSKWARPESLRKSWTLWVPVCTSGMSPSQECASIAELSAIQRLELTAEIRNRVQN
jgi:hypothetical protein